MRLSALVQSRLTADDVQRGDHRVDDVVRPWSPSRVSPTTHLPTPSSVRAAAIASAVLPTPPGPTTTTSRCVASRSDRATSSAVATDELDGHRRQVADGVVPVDRDRRVPGGIERRVVDQDLLLELLQLRAGFEAELVGQPIADPLVRGQGVGLAAAAVERGDQQHPQALLERVGGDRRFQLADHVTGLTELSTGREPRLDQLQSAPLRVAPGAG